MFGRKIAVPLDVMLADEKEEEERIQHGQFIANLDECLTPKPIVKFEPN